MALSLDSMYYHHNQPQNVSHNSQDLFNVRQHNFSQQIQVQHYPDYSSFGGQELYQMTQVKNKEAQLSHDQNSTCMKTLISFSHYPTCHAVEQKMVECISAHNGVESGSVGEEGYGNIQSLSSSMSPGLQSSSCVTSSLYFTINHICNPDKNNVVTLLRMATSATKLLSASTNDGSWISTTQLGPHVPIFAAWTDA